jgi:hypothetical protein
MGYAQNTCYQRVTFWALLTDFAPISSIEDWIGVTCHADVYDFDAVMGVWGLTCDFWAEIGE